MELIVAGIDCRNFLGLPCLRVLDKSCHNSQLRIDQNYSHGLTTLIPICQGLSPNKEISPLEREIRARKKGKGGKNEGEREKNKELRERN